MKSAHTPPRFARSRGDLVCKAKKIRSENPRSLCTDNLPKTNAQSDFKGRAEREEKRKTIRSSIA